MSIAHTVLQVTQCIVWVSGKSEEEEEKNKQGASFSSLEAGNISDLLPQVHLSMLKFCKSDLKTLLLAVTVAIWVFPSAVYYWATFSALLVVC